MFRTERSHSNLMTWFLLLSPGRGIIHISMCQNMKMMPREQPFPRISDYLAPLSHIGSHQCGCVGRNGLFTTRAPFFQAYLLLPPFAGEDALSTESDYAGRFSRLGHRSNLGKTEMGKVIALLTVLLAYNESIIHVLCHRCPHRRVIEVNCTDRLLGTRILRSLIYKSSIVVFP